MNLIRAFSLLIFALFSSVLNAQFNNNSNLIPASKALFEDYLDKYEEAGFSIQNRILKNVAEDLKTATIRFVNATERDEPMDEYSWECHEVKGGGENLLVMPGGKILFFSEMFSLANTENKIAWYLSHGIAHTLIDEGEDNTIHTFGVIGEEGKRFSNYEEILADQLGAKIMAIAGYDPQIGVATWEDLKDAEKIPYLNYHPFYEDKLMSLKSFAMDGRKVGRKYGVSAFK